MSLQKGTVRLRDPQTYYDHDDGRVTYHCISSIPGMLTAQSSSGTDTGVVQDLLFQSGMGFSLRHRFDTLRSPHQQGSVPTNTGGIHELAYQSAKSAATPGSRTLSKPFAEVVGGDVYAKEYNRYLVESATYIYKITSYEPFPIVVGCTIGATAIVNDKADSFANHLANGFLKFGANYGMATSRWLFEATDVSKDADGVVASSVVNDLSTHLIRLPDTKHINIPAAPNSGVAIYSSAATVPGDHTQKRGVTRTLKVTVPVIRLLNSVATAGLGGSKAGMAFSVDNHGGVVVETAVETQAAIAPNPASETHFLHPGSAHDGGTPSTFSVGGVFGTLWVVPKDPMRRMLANNTDDSDAMKLSSGHVFVQMESYHSVRLYDRKLNLPIAKVPDAFIGLGEMQYDISTALET